MEFRHRILVRCEQALVSKYYLDTVTEYCYCRGVNQQLRHYADLEESPLANFRLSVFLKEMEEAVFLLDGFLAHFDIEVFHFEFFEWGCQCEGYYYPTNAVGNDSLDLRIQFLEGALHPWSIKITEEDKEPKHLSSRTLDSLREQLEKELI